MTQYEALKNKVTKRKIPFDNLINFLEIETSWLSSPASTRFHLNEDGGLLKHSIGVTENLLRLRETFAPEISEESCVIVGLFHDIGKIGMPGKPLYIHNNNGFEVSNRKKYRINPGVVNMGLAVRSLYIVSKYLPLSDSEAQALVYHDGQYISDNRIIAHKEEPLTLLLHWADYWTAHIFEEGREIKNSNEYFECRE